MARLDSTSSFTSTSSVWRSVQIATWRAQRDDETEKLREFQTYEEYRQNRSQVSEWFARLCEAGNQNWLIILDSSKAKERKARSSMVDKVRTDFPKFSSKLDMGGGQWIWVENFKLLILQASGS
jgi:hypothetical protein